MKPTRPILRYPGGKWQIAEWVRSFFPPHVCYVEPFGGAASVLLQKDRAEVEIYNDLDDDVVRLFHVLRNPILAESLRRQVVMTPYAAAEFRQAHTPSEDPVEHARRLTVRSFMGHGSSGGSTAKKTGFRRAYIGNHNAATDWAGWPDHIPAIVDRLRGVVIENRPAEEVIEHYDTPETLFYVDPPYVADTRPSGALYKHELTDAGHVSLAETLHRVAGMVVLSGYPSPLYDRLYGDWKRFERPHRADSRADRTEVVWLNNNCAAKQATTQFDFGGAA